jgi:hypothetical protein
MRPVRKKHILLLILSCVCLVVALSGAKDLLEYFLLPDAPLGGELSPPSDGGMGAGLAALLGDGLRWFALFVLLMGSLPFLCAGGVISVILASRRRDKPVWLWGVSLGLAIAFGLIAVGLILAGILI